MKEKSKQLYRKLMHLQGLLHKHHNRHRGHKGPMADPTRGQGRVIAILKLQDGISTKDLSYLLGIRVSSLNELLGKMEKNGYITRQPSEADKRVILVKLTEKGRSEEQQDWEAGDLFACLSDEEQTAFGDYLDRITAGLIAELGEEAGEDERAWWAREGRARMGDDAFDRFADMMGGMPFPPGFEGMHGRGKHSPRHGRGGHCPHQPPHGPKDHFAGEGFAPEDDE